MLEEEAITIKEAEKPHLGTGLEDVESFIPEKLLESVHILKRKTTHKTEEHLLK